MDRNPYETPGAPLEDRQPPSGRPLGVWLVCGFYGLGVVSMLVLAPLVLGGALPATEEDLDPVVWTLSAIHTGVSAWFVVQLFRLRAVAVELCAVQMVLTLVGAAWQVLVVYAPGDPTVGAVLTMTVFGLAVDGLVLFYLLRLRGQGVLR